MSRQRGLWLLARYSKPSVHYRHPDEILDRSTITVEHLQKGRIVARHDLAHLCECCERVNAKMIGTERTTEERWE